MLRREGGGAQAARLVAQLGFETLTPARIFRFWSPLAATWLMMAAEGPFVAALIARLPDAKFNLAAFGVAFSLALLVEAPIMMIMSAAIALVRDRATFLKLRHFIYALNGAITLAMGALLAPPVFRLLAEGLIGLPPNVAALTHGATAILLPWPAAIGYRRFYQGVLIGGGLTRRVAYGTIVRISSMAIAGAGLFALGVLPGAFVGAAALATGVTAEAVASRLMARGVVRRLLAESAARGSVAGELTTRSIVTFYFPLALTSILTLGVSPLVTFFVGRSRFPIESLAVMPVVFSLAFIFRSSGFAYQEVCVALLGEGREGLAPLRRFSCRPR